MGFGGSVAAMISSLKANKRTRVSTFDKIKEIKKGKKSELQFKKNASPIELKKIRDKIQEENQKVFRKKNFVLVASLIIILLLLN